MSAVLVVDAGNSRTKFARCQSGSEPLPDCVSFQAVDNSDALQITDRLRDLAAEHSGCVLAGSNGPLRDRLESLWPAERPRPTVIRSWDQIPLETDVEAIETVGIDRLLNAAAARSIAPGGRSIVVDSGTATTVDVVDGGVFCGGAILPGMRLAARSLHDYTAALPEVDSGQLNVETVAVPGRNTQAAIEAGLLIGQIGAIRELVGCYRSQVGEDAMLILTGGAAERLMPAFPGARFMPFLSLRFMATLAGNP